MGNNSLILFICVITPLAMMLFVFKGKSRVTLLFLMIGIIMCLVSGEISGMILKMSGLSKYYLSINVTPFAEELLKALPVLALTFMFKPKRQELLECSLAVGVGFAILENVYIFSNISGEASVGWALIRGFGAGMMHGICTLCVGYTMTFVYTKRKVFFVGSFAALSVAALYHSIYNLVIQSEYKPIGILLPVLTYIPLIIALARKKIKKSDNNNE